VQGRRGDRHAADLDRLEDRHRGDHARAADLDLDAQQGGGAGVGGELVGDAPARRPAGRAGLVAVGGPVGLDHRAVDAETEGEPLVVEVVDRGDDLIDRRAQWHAGAGAGRGGHAQRRDIGHRARV
jgi:hypothetical protein